MTSLIDAATPPTFHRLADASADDMAEIFKHYHALRNAIPDHLASLLKLLAGEKLGFPVDRLEHSLQTATRAHRAGADDQTVICALLHDVGDNIAPDNHGAFAAEILRPWVSAENYWIVRNHNDFLGGHYFDKIGRDPNLRDKHRGHPAFEKACQFCDAWDAASFDPTYDSFPLEAFLPALRSVFSGEPWQHADQVIGGH